jgi:hypothetical protein
MRINYETGKFKDPRSIVLGNHDDLLKGFAINYIKTGESYYHCRQLFL